LIKQLWSGGVKIELKPKALATEFRDFLVKHNAMALAVGVIIAAAVGKVVSGIVDDILMPLVGLAMPGGEWRNAQVVLSGSNAIKYGDLIGRVLDFVIVAAIVFIIVKLLLREKPKPPTTKACPRCLEQVPLLATRCRACTSDL
jgi:large conductance mechanosensitive channel